MTDEQPALLTPGGVAFPDHAPTSADLDELINQIGTATDRVEEDHADTRRGRLVRTGTMQLTRSSGSMR